MRHRAAARRSEAGVVDEFGHGPTNRTDAIRRFDGVELVVDERIESEPGVRR
jgi:hypothetical protein